MIRISKSQELDQLNAPHPGNSSPAVARANLLSIICFAGENILASRPHYDLHFYSQRVMKQSAKRINNYMQRKVK